MTGICHIGESTSTKKPIDLYQPKYRSIPVNISRIGDYQPFRQENMNRPLEKSKEKKRWKLTQSPHFVTVARLAATMLVVAPMLRVTFPSSFCFVPLQLYFCWCFSGSSSSIFLLSFSNYFIYFFLCASNFVWVWDSKPSAFTWALKFNFS